MAIKVDPEKAYDRLSWSFIHKTQVDTCVPSTLIRIIIECIASAKMNVLWNGEFTEDFKPSRGTRQGDSISPYIFALCFEGVSHGICSSMDNGEWKPV